MDNEKLDEHMQSELGVELKDNFDSLLESRIRQMFAEYEIDSTHINEIIETTRYQFYREMISIAENNQEVTLFDQCNAICTDFENGDESNLVFIFSQLVYDDSTPSPPPTLPTFIESLLNKIQK